MKEVRIIRVDLAKNVSSCMAEHPQCLVVMEACGGAHHWARELERAATRCN